MCEAEQEGVTTVFFPTPGVPVTVDNIQSVALDHWVHYLPKCTEGKTARIGTIGNNTRKRRDVSLCDVLSGGGDFIYIPTTDTIFFKSAPIPFQMFAVISFTTVYLAVILGHNMEVALGTNKTPSNVLVTEMVIVVQIILLLFASGGPISDIMTVFVTAEDRFVFTYLITYSAYYVLRSLYAVYTAQTAMITPVNPVIATLTMVSMRIHYTLDNPYTTLAALLIATRFINKVALFTRAADARSGAAAVRLQWSELIGALDMLADAALVSLLIYAGVIPHHGREPIVTGLYMVQGTFVALTLNQLMLRLEEKTKL